MPWYFPYDPTNRCLWGHLFVPQAEAAEEGVLVVAHAAGGGQFIQFLDVAATQDYVIGQEGGTQSGHYVENGLLPLAAAQAFQAGLPYIILESKPFFIGQMS